MGSTGIHKGGGKGGKESTRGGGLLGLNFEVFGYIIGQGKSNDRMGEYEKSLKQYLKKYLKSICKGGAMSQAPGDYLSF